MANAGVRGEVLWPDKWLPCTILGVGRSDFPTTRTDEHLVEGQRLHVVTDEGATCSGAHPACVRYVRDGETPEEAQAERTRLELIVAGLMRPTEARGG